MKHIIKVEVLENLPLTRPLIAMDKNKRFFQEGKKEPAGPPNDEIWYTSSSGKIVVPYKTTSLPKIVSNEYSDGKGIIKFETDVTSIGLSAFQSRSGLISITIPSGVTSIGNYAFSGCSNLISITIPSGVTSIGNYAFNGCTHLTSAPIPSGVTSIGNYVFSGCKGLTSTTIPNGVTSIRDHAFQNCSGLTSVTIGNSVTSIEDHAFAYCGSLTSIEIPDSVTSIGEYAFYDCGSLTSATIGNSVISIGQYTFAWCNRLTSVIIPNSVTSIGFMAFCNVSNIVYSGIATGSPWEARCVNGTIDGYLVYSDETKTILKACFTTASGIISIPNSVTTIGVRTFYSCSSLTSVTIPNSVTSIGNSAFESCSSLTSIEIPNNVTSIGASTFAGCTSLTSATIPNSVTNIDYDAFWDGGYAEGEYYSGSLETITVGETVFTYDQESDYFTITLGNGTDVDLLMWTSSCFLSDTEITLSDGTKKQVKDITYDDKLKVWNFDEGHYDEGEIAWLTKVGLKNNHYYQLTFSDGTILKTTGVHSNHKVYCTDTNKFEGVAYIEVGAHVFTENGIVTITDKQYIEEEVEYYNLITKQHFNCFANGILTSDRYGNIYPISDNMIFVKNGRPIRPYSEFEAVNIKRYWYDTLRLGENTETINETRKYITKLEVQMRPIE